MQATGQTRPKSCPLLALGILQVVACGLLLLFIFVLIGYGGGLGILLDISIAIFVLISGVFCIVASRSSNRCLAITAIILCIIASILAVALLFVYAVSLWRYLRYAGQLDGLSIISLAIRIALALMASIVAIVSSVLTCMACRKNPTTGDGYVYQQSESITMTTA